MKRLIAFGCSYTYGQGIDGVTPIHPPSPAAWPAKLANQLNRSVVNCSKPGSGNLEILHNILNFEFHKDDVCVIMWSFFDRECLFTTTGIERIHFGTRSRKEKHWLAVHSTVDHRMRNWLNIHHANQHLTAIGVPNVYNVFGGDFDDRFKIPDHLPIKNVLDVEFDNVDYGTDGKHPGKESHALMAGKLYEKIKSGETL